MGIVFKALFKILKPWNQRILILHSIYWDFENITDFQAWESQTAIISTLFVEKSSFISPQTLPFELDPRLSLKREREKSIQWNFQMYQCAFQLFHLILQLHVLLFSCLLVGGGLPRCSADCNISSLYQVRYAHYAHPLSAIETIMFSYTWGSCTHCWNHWSLHAAWPALSSLHAHAERQPRAPALKQTPNL